MDVEVTRAFDVETCAHNTGSHDRTNIRAAATRLFATRGYEAVGIRELVDAVGVTKPTLYHYFGSKRGVLDAALEEHFTTLFAAIEPL